MPVFDMPPKIQFRFWRVGLSGHVTGLSKRHLEHEAAAIVGDSAHDVQPTGSATHPDIVLHRIELLTKDLLYKYPFGILDFVGILT